MHVVHVSNSLSRNGGGIFEIELALTTHLRDLGVNSTAIGIEDAGWAFDADRWGGVSSIVCTKVGPGAFNYSPALSTQIANSHADLGHLHTLWTYPGLALRRWCLSKKRPLIVTPNGMLDPWALRNSRWKKRISELCFEKTTLHSATCLHANTEKEACDIRAYGVAKPICIIPNGVSLPDLTSSPISPRNDSRKVLLYLGRLHPKKGLADAILAWGRLLKNPKTRHLLEDWDFVIAGWDQGGHEQVLKSLCKAEGIESRDIDLQDFVSVDAGIRSKSAVIFAGPAFNSLKASLFRSAHAFVLPSHSEGMPMAVLEAWSYALPVLMTDACNLPGGFARKAAYRFDVMNGHALISGGLLEFLTMNKGKLSAMGHQGRRLVEEKYTWDCVAQEMLHVYRWMLGEADQPACISCD